MFLFGVPIYFPSNNVCVLCLLSRLQAYTLKKETFSKRMGLSREVCIYTIFTFSLGPFSMRCSLFIVIFSRLL